VIVPGDVVLFDCDGVLVDSRTAGEAAWTTWAERRRLDPAVVLNGIHGRRSVESVARFVAADEVAAAVAELDALELAGAGDTAAIPGAAELLAGLPRERWAVVTSAPEPLARARLAAAGLPAPPVLITSEVVSAGKPAPDPYLAAAAAVGVPAGVAIVVEDTPAGIVAARAAGVRSVVGVGADAGDADVVVRDLRGLEWRDGALWRGSLGR
jgi:sugar-phosphatase